MNSSRSLQPTQASAVLRTFLALSSAVLLLCGIAGLLMVFRLFTVPENLRPSWLGSQDLIIAALLGVVALSLLMMGINVLVAAWRARRRNIIPGPTLYLFGVTLVILGLFQLAAGALLSALVLGMIGAVAMWLEMQFDFI